MKITIDFGHPYFEEEVLLGLTPDDLNCFYADASEVDRLNLFFVLEASLHRLQGKERMKTAAYCAFLSLELTQPLCCLLSVLLPLSVPSLLFLVCS